MTDLFEKILDSISTMTDEEFQAELDKYKDSDIVLTLKQMEDFLTVFEPTEQELVEHEFYLHELFHEEKETK
ncbi:hypothetical protein D3C87_324710 [compost metagenome]